MEVAIEIDLITGESIAVVVIVIVVIDKKYDNNNNYNSSNESTYGKRIEQTRDPNKASQPPQQQQSPMLGRTQRIDFEVEYAPQYCNQTLDCIASKYHLKRGDPLPYIYIIYIWRGYWMDG